MARTENDTVDLRRKILGLYAQGYPQFHITGMLGITGADIAKFGSSEAKLSEGAASNERLFLILNSLKTGELTEHDAIRPNFDWNRFEQLDPDQVRVLEAMRDVPTSQVANTTRRLVEKFPADTIRTYDDTRRKMDVIAQTLFPQEPYSKLGVIVAYYIGVGSGRLQVNDEGKLTVNLHVGDSRQEV